MFLLAEGMAKAISSLMVIFNRLQLDDLGSEESRACGGQKKINKKIQSVCLHYYYSTQFSSLSQSGDYITHNAN